MLYFFPPLQLFIFTRKNSFVITNIKHLYYNVHFASPRYLFFFSWASYYTKTTNYAVEMRTPNSADAPSPFPNNQQTPHATHISRPGNCRCTLIYSEITPQMMYVCVCVVTSTVCFYVSRVDEWRWCVTVYVCMRACVTVCAYRGCDKQSDRRGKGSAEYGLWTKEYPASDK